MNFCNLLQISPKTWKSPNGKVVGISKLYNFDKFIFGKKWLIPDFLFWALI
jgi:hypothetical protein